MNILHKFTVELPLGKKETIRIRKPTRMEIDEADMMYSTFMSECITRGILTRDMLLKRYKDFGGVLSENEAKTYKQLLKRIVELNRQLAKTKAVKKRKEIEGEMEDIYSAIQEVEQTQEDLFDRTAETIAKNKTILWLVFLLAVKDKEDEPYYAGDDYDERYEVFAGMEEKDMDSAHLILEKLCLYVSFWYSNKNVTSDDFESLEGFLNKSEAEDASSGD